MRIYAFLLFFLLASRGFAQVDIAVSLSDSPDPVALGANLTYTIVVTNNGNVAANNVAIADVLPSSMTFQTVQTADDCQCTVPEVGTTGTVACTKTRMEPSEAVSLLIVIKPSASGAVPNTATVTSTEQDLNAENNTASEETIVMPGPESGYDGEEIPPEMPPPHPYHSKSFRL